MREESSTKHKNKIFDHKAGVFQNQRINQILRTYGAKHDDCKLGDQVFHKTGTITNGLRCGHRSRGKHGNSRGSVNNKFPRWLAGLVMVSYGL